ncbi:hypothetical protein [Halorussus sp. MSC15.2]|uniref:hypothetical protein n=1 Tax=Halorussus sp. MSC15.2 TaxID=2283638 RepID=UPI0013D5FC2B|nr:hypothetical protein [Halorussus sp. MSC15.2]NEU56387.1 hypothetical protein [Halorussus sp. MSC15.2]
MANPHEIQGRREEANQDGLHESRESSHQDWTDLDREEGGEQHHHHHHHHHGGESQQSDPDYEQKAEEALSRIRGNEGRGSGRSDRQRGGTASQQGHDFGENESGHTDRHGSRGANDLGTSRSPRIESVGSSGHGEQSGTEQHRGSHREQGRQQSDDRRYGQRRQQRGREGAEHGTAHEGSQRGSHREEGLAGRMMGQRGEQTHHSDPSDSTFRDQTSGEREHRHGGERGTSERDRRFGSRRGHGSERHTGDRHSSH